MPRRRRGALPRRPRRPSRRAGHLSVDRRAAAHQRARHVHDHQRLADAAGGARGDGGRLAALRAPRRADGGHRRAPGRAHEGGVGHGHVRLLGRAHARDRRLRGRRQSRSPRADSRTCAASRRTKCIIPRHSRNVYDAAVRAVGVRVVEVATAEELEAAFGPRTAMVYILAGPNADEGPLSTKAIAQLAQARSSVPVLVDAAAEILTVPNVHLQNGADARRLQRRQVPARPADRGPAARAQGPGPGRLGPQRAASRLRPRR